MGTWASKPTEFYLHSLGDKDHRVRCQAVAALELHRDRRAINPLIQVLLNDEHDEVRATAARALGKLEGDEAVAPLIQAAVHDSTRDVRLHAVQSLAILQHTSSVEGLIQALQDPDREVRYYTAQALGTFGDTRAVAPLMQALRDEAQYNRDSSYAASIAMAIGGLGEPAVVPLLEALGDANRNLRECAVVALMYTGDSRAHEALATALADEDIMVRRLAQFALDQLGLQGA